MNDNIPGNFQNFTITGLNLPSQKGEKKSGSPLFEPPDYSSVKEVTLTICDNKKGEYTIVLSAAEADKKGDSDFLTAVFASVNQSENQKLEYDASNNIAVIAGKEFSVEVQPKKQSFIDKIKNKQVISFEESEYVGYEAHEYGAALDETLKFEGEVFEQLEQVAYKGASAFEEIGSIPEYLDIIQGYGIDIPFDDKIENFIENLHVEEVVEGFETAELTVNSAAFIAQGVAVGKKAFGQIKVFQLKKEVKEILGSREDKKEIIKKINEYIEIEEELKKASGQEHEELNKKAGSLSEILSEELGDDFFKVKDLLSQIHKIKKSSKSSVRKFFYRGALTGKSGAVLLGKKGAAFVFKVFSESYLAVKYTKKAIKYSKQANQEEKNFKLVREMCLEDKKGSTEHKLHTLQLKYHHTNFLEKIHKTITSSSTALVSAFTVANIPLQIIALAGALGLITVGGVVGMVASVATGVLGFASFVIFCFGTGYLIYKNRHKINFYRKKYLTKAGRKEFKKPGDWLKSFIKNEKKLEKATGEKKIQLEEKNRELLTKLKENLKLDENASILEITNKVAEKKKEEEAIFELSCELEISFEEAKNRVEELDIDDCASILFIKDGDDLKDFTTKVELVLDFVKGGPVPA